jgi:uncharacterized protein
MFELNLRRLEKGPVEFRGAISADDPVWGDSDTRPAGDVAVEATATGSPTRGVHVRGSLSAEILRACRRCLEPVRLSVSDDFSLLFDPKISRIEEDLRAYALDPRAELLDLKPALRERFILAVPTYIVCSSDCRGLCARCGANLNEEACECGPVGPDPRWGPLVALRREP